jgi:hypothetical protein
MVFIDFMVFPEVNEHAIMHVPNTYQSVIRIKEEYRVSYVMPMVPEAAVAIPPVGNNSGKSMIPSVIVNPYQVMTLAYKSGIVMPLERHVTLILITIMMSVSPISVVAVPMVITLVVSVAVVPIIGVRSDRS